MVANLTVIELTTLIILLALVAVPISWLLPASRALDGIAIWTALVLAALSPLTAAWLIGAACLTPFVLQWGERTGNRGLTAAAWSAALLGAFVGAQLSPGLVWIGSAFFTLRHIHIVGDWWMGRLAVPRLRSHLHYQLFLPVMFVGPIHRIQNFERQSTRRRWHPDDFLAGMERALVGAFVVNVMGGTLSDHVRNLALAALGDGHAFSRDWVVSALDWISLFFVFSGLTSVALGISLMMGFRLEENFMQPWRARNMIDFWARWHMSLTSWSRDYVYKPVMAISRSPLLGLVAAMLVVGLWHELSLYYVLWSFWQVLGIALSRIGGRWLTFESLPRPVQAILVPVSILAWLSLARPVLVRLMELLS